MGILNRVVNILILVLAIVAVVFGFMLFQKREQLRRRGDEMAKMINDVAGILDNNSETAYAGKLVPNKLELNAEKDPANAAGNQKISLYHNNYANLATVLSEFKKQAQDLGLQRDILGTTLRDVAETLEIPESFSVGDFQSVQTYDEKKSELINLVQKVNERDNALVRQIAQSAGVIGFSVDSGALKNLDNYATPLAEFGNKVQGLKTRSDTYDRHITSVCQILEVSSPSLAGEDYSSALMNVETAVRGVKTEFENTKAKLKLTEEQLAETRDKLRLTEEKYATLKDKYDKLLKRYNEYFTSPGGDIDGQGVVQDGSLWRELEGSIVDVNNKWDFVVIDLGKSNKIMRNNREIPVALPPNQVMTVARENQYLAKIKIVRVNEHCAIADVLSEERNGELTVGDKVFFSKAEAKPDADDGMGGFDDDMMMP